MRVYFRDDTDICRAVYGPDTGVDEGQCAEPPPVSGNMTVAENALSDQCDCFPEWMFSKGLFFDPLSTLYSAIAAVLGYTLYLKVSSSRAIWATMRGTEKDAVLSFLKAFKRLPRPLQFAVQQKLLEILPDMPAIEEQSGGTTKVVQPKLMASASDPDEQNRVRRCLEDAAKALQEIPLNIAPEDLFRLVESHNAKTRRQEGSSSGEKISMA